MPPKRHLWPALQLRRSGELEHKDKRTRPAPICAGRVLNMVPKDSVVSSNGVRVPLSTQNRYARR